MVDEIAAARFEKRVNEHDTTNPPTTSETLNSALKIAGDRAEFSQVMVILHDPKQEALMFFTNIPSQLTLLGLLSLASKGPGR